MSSIIIIGSGARECAILMKLLQSNFARYYNFITVGVNANPFCVKKSRFITVENYNLSTIQELDIFVDVKYVIIGPEAPIVSGLANWLNDKGIYVFAPTKENAKIESSKAFTRKLIESNINSKFNPRFQIINDNNIDLCQRLKSIKETFKSDIVIKKDGLCGGKGVYVEGEHFNVSNLSLESDFLMGLSDYLSIESNCLVIEEKLVGIEFSLMTITDGNGVVNLKPVFDYKRLENNDTGPNTGSMGCVLLTDNNLMNLVDSNLIWEAETVNKRVINYLSNLNDVKYQGVLYGSFMVCNNELKVIEFNCRFGDPEGAVALLNLDLDLIEILNSAENGVLSELPKQKKLQTNIVGVYLVPENYAVNNAESSEKYDIFFRGDLANVNKKLLDENLENLNSEISIVYGDCDINGDHIYTRKSRTLLLLGKSKVLYKAINLVYKNIENIVSKLKYRTDIGSKFITKYEMAGVSISNANTTLGNIKDMLKFTYNQNVKSELGDFGGVYNLNGEELVSSIDGVGTKTDFIDTYFSKSEYEGLGKDIVNHSINDILVMGAKPLFFLDYYGTSALDRTQFTSFIKGASKALCFDESNPIPLIGGETAEMPSVYKWEKNDIVGCIIGKLDSAFVKYTRPPIKGDCLLGIRSEGPHTNGFSLINNIPWSQELLDKSPISKIKLEGFFEYLRTPHTNYYPIVKDILETYGPSACIRMCHITGGGLYENLERVIPKELELQLNNEVLDAHYPQWCNIIEIVGNISKDEMYKVFNCGIGFVLIVSEELKACLLQDNNFNIELFELGFLK